MLFHGNVGNKLFFLRCGTSYGKYHGMLDLDSSAETNRAPCAEVATCRER